MEDIELRYDENVNGPNTPGMYLDMHSINRPQYQKVLEFLSNPDLKDMFYLEESDFSEEDNKFYKVCIRTYENLDDSAYGKCFLDLGKLVSDLWALEEIE